MERVRQESGRYMNTGQKKHCLVLVAVELVPFVRKPDEKNTKDNQKSCKWIWHCSNSWLVLKWPDPGGSLVCCRESQNRSNTPFLLLQPGLSQNKEQDRCHVYIGNRSDNTGIFAVFIFFLPHSAQGIFHSSPRGFDLRLAMAAAASCFHWLIRFSRW